MSSTVFELLDDIGRTTAMMDASTQYHELDIPREDQLRFAPHGYSIDPDHNYDLDAYEDAISSPLCSFNITSAESYENGWPFR